MACPESTAVTAPDQEIVEPNVDRLPIPVLHEFIQLVFGDGKAGYCVDHRIRLAIEQIV
jgi:hypothetical protein